MKTNVVILLLHTDDLPYDGNTNPRSSAETTGMLEGMVGERRMAEKAKRMW